MFITVEYRRGLIRTTFTAIPAAGRGARGQGVWSSARRLRPSVPSPIAVGRPTRRAPPRSNGNYVFPTSTLTEVRIIVGSRSGLVAVTAIVVTALSATILRNSAAAVTAGVVVFVLPSHRSPSPQVAGSPSGCSGSPRPPGSRVLRSPAPVHQVSYPYTLSNGYYPLSPLGRACRPVRLRRPRARPRQRPAAPERRMIDAAPGRVDQAAHPRRHRLAADRCCRRHRRRQRRSSPPPRTSPWQHGRTPPSSPSPASTSARPSSPCSPYWPSPRSTAPA